MDIHSNLCYALGYETPRYAPTTRSSETTGHRASAGWKNLSVGGRNVERIAEFGGPLGPSASAGRQDRLASPTHSGTASAVVCHSENPIGPTLSGWPPCRRLLHGCVDTASDRTSDCPTVPSSLSPGARLATDGATGLDLPEAPATGAGTRRSCHRPLEALPVAAY